jgi:hypothetical protein
MNQYWKLYYALKNMLEWADYMKQKFAADILPASIEANKAALEEARTPVCVKCGGEGTILQEFHGIKTPFPCNRCNGEGSSRHFSNQEAAKRDPYDQFTTNLNNVFMTDAFDRDKKILCGKNRDLITEIEKIIQGWYNSDNENYTYCAEQVFFHVYEKLNSSQSEYSESTERKQYDHMFEIALPTIKRLLKRIDELEAQLPPNPATITNEELLKEAEDMWEAFPKVGVHGDISKGNAISMYISAVIRHRPSKYLNPNSNKQP